MAANPPTDSTSIRPATPKGIERVVPVLILTLTFLAYIPALNAGFIWDDDFHVFANPNLLDLEGLYRIWFTTENQQYYPLVYSSFWLEEHIWGLNPAGYHIVNIALHSLNAFLVYVIARRLDLKWALLAALIFALHPVHVESVAWVSERKNLLSGFCYLLSLLFYLKSEKEDIHRLKWYILSLVLFLAALLSKTVTCTLPAAIIILTWMRSMPLSGKLIKRLIPYFVIGLVMGMVTVIWEMVFVGASGSEWTLPLIERLKLPGMTALFYIKKLLLPLDLSFIYPRWSMEDSPLWHWVFTATLSSVFIMLFLLKERIGRAPAAALAFFTVTLLPALGLFNVYPFRYSFVADHFQYLASLGMITLFTALLHWFIRVRMKLGTKTLWIVGAVILTTLSILTFRQTHEYRDYETIWRAVLEKNPDAWIAHNNIGTVLSAKGMDEEALGHFKRSIELNPNDAVSYYNIANQLSGEARLNEANDLYRKAISIRNSFGEAHYNLANNQYLLGRLEEAIEHYGLAVKYEPKEADYRFNLGNALLKSGNVDGAIKEYEAALEIRPDYDGAARNMGTALRIKSRK